MWVSLWSPGSAHLLVIAENFPLPAAADSFPSKTLSSSREQKSGLVDSSRHALSPLSFDVPRNLSATDSKESPQPSPPSLRWRITFPNSQKIISTGILSDVQTLQKNHLYVKRKMGYFSVFRQNTGNWQPHAVRNQFPAEQPGKGPQNCGLVSNSSLWALHYLKHC